MGRPNQAINFVIPTASFDGKYYSRYPGGDRPEPALFSDDFESGTLSHAENNIAYLERISVSASADRAYSGNYSAKFTFPDAASGADPWAELRFGKFDDLNEIWIGYKLWVPANYYHRIGPDSSNNKGLFMFWNAGGHDDNGNNGYDVAPHLMYSSFQPGDNGNSTMDVGWKTDGATSHHYIEQDDGPDGDQINIIDRATDLGRWIDFVCRVKVCDLGQSNGIFQIWKDGVRIWSLTDATNRAGSNPSDANAIANNPLQYGYILGWANSGFDNETSLYVDDLKIATTNVFGVS